MKTKLEIAKDAVDELFSDTSVSAEETLDALEDVQAGVEMKIEALREQLDK